MVLLEISQNSQENTCARVFFLIKLPCNFIKKETLAQVLSWEFCEISKNTPFLQNTSGQLLIDLGKNAENLVMILNHKDKLWILFYNFEGFL